MKLARIKGRSGRGGGAVELNDASSSAHAPALVLLEAAVVAAAAAAAAGAGGRVLDRGGAHRGQVPAPEAGRPPQESPEVQAQVRTRG